MADQIRLLMIRVDNETFANIPD